MNEKAAKVASTLQLALVLGLSASLIFVVGLSLGVNWDAESVKTKMQRQAIAAGCASYRTDADGEPEFYFIQKLAADAEAE